MEITLQISSLIIICLGITGILVSIGTAIFCLIQRKPDDQSMVLLFLLLTSIGLTLLNETLTTSGISNRFKNLYFLPLNFSLSIAPLFYLFIKLKINRKFNRIDSTHLLLPILQFLTFLIVGFQPISNKSKLWNNDFFRAILNLESILFVVGLIIYSIFSYISVNRISTKQVFWKADLKKYLLRMVKVFTLLAIFELILFFGEMLASTRFSELFYVFRSLLFVLLIGWVVYNTFKLLYPKTIYTSSPQGQLIDQTDFQGLMEKLSMLMNVDKVYLNPDLSLQILAKYLDVSEKKCSRFFSSTLNTNFKSYINQQRVKEFKKQINSGKCDHLTILGIAFDSGFDSKTTFNRVFKKLEGITPSQYRNLNKNA